MILTQKEIDKFCKKYNLKFARADYTWRLFIYSKCFSPRGWITLFPEGYYNSFAEFRKDGINKFRLTRQARLPKEDPSKPGCYVFGGDYLKADTKKEFDEWLKFITNYVRTQLPIEYKRKII